MELQFTEDDNPGIRLDRFLAGQLPECSRSRLQTLIRDGHILLNGCPAKPKQTLVPGDSIQVTLPEPEPGSVQPEAIAIRILHEDEDLIVVDKESGIVVHPGAGNATGTLVSALLHHCASLSSVGAPLRPGIVHRLDKDTSGCIVVAKTDRAHHSLTDSFAKRRVSKKYLALVEHAPLEKSGRLESRIGRHPGNRLKMAEVPYPAGKPAITDYTVLSTSGDGATLIECDLHTGRTHQIRVHMKSLKTPILGDEIYAQPNRQKVQSGRLMLHAWVLGFAHPVSGEPLTFEAPIPVEFTPYLPIHSAPPTPP